MKLELASVVLTGAALALLTCWLVLPEAFTSGILDVRSLAYWIFGILEPQNPFGSLR